MFFVLFGEFFIFGFCFLILYVDVFYDTSIFVSIFKVSLFSIIFGYGSDIINIF